MISPIESSTLWYSKDLEARKDGRYQLTKENIIELENAWQQVQLREYCTFSKKQKARFYTHSNVCVVL